MKRKRNRQNHMLSFKNISKNCRSESPCWLPTTWLQWITRSHVMMRLQNAGDGQKALQASMLVGRGERVKSLGSLGYRMAGSFSATKSKLENRGQFLSSLKRELTPVWHHCSKIKYDPCKTSCDLICISLKGSYWHLWSHKVNNKTSKEKMWE